MYYIDAEHDEIQFPALIVIVICVFTYFIAATFMAVYRMAIDTLLICFCEDSENNKGQGFMSKRLEKFMSEEDRRIKEENTEKQPLVSTKM
jgi:solute carrier family 44 protein 1 (choline transporter-like protein)